MTRGSFDKLGIPACPRNDRGSAKRTLSFPIPNPSTQFSHSSAPRSITNDSSGTSLPLICRQSMTGRASHHHSKLGRPRGFSFRSSRSKTSRKGPGTNDEPKPNRQSERTSSPVGLEGKEEPYSSVCAVGVAENGVGKRSQANLDWFLTITSKQHRHHRVSHLRLCQTH